MKREIREKRNEYRKKSVELHNTRLDELYKKFKFYDGIIKAIERVNYENNNRL